MKALALAAALLASAAVGAAAAHTGPAAAWHGPVCHAVTEDSVITDCDYTSGAWFQK